ncbi:TPA: hypothetical protein OO122_002529 [Legionella pneumophila]|nr:hypothetical protein [Legionella pneumophila]HAT2065184.1 hypothetical protein [Legionella pneumophila]HAT8591490.1 hypothetical protein [Legionella pneumophila]HAU1575412.1 hypothetical protein [Legionella pneumophila]HAU1682128.1 hypothetical protein [Legionella pneumophila]HAU3699098.1 hypothetical protein [Legionella pneumophila]
MKTIFANKDLLYNQYKKMFLEQISDISKLKECVKARYDIKELSDEIFFKLLTNNHKKIYDFIGIHNQNRIRYFFGNFDNFDPRDNQISVLDRFILDSVHFYITSSLLMQLHKEYQENAMEIDKAWQKEIQAHSHFGPLPTIAIVGNLIKSNKNRVFKDLQFPANKNIQLFQLNKSSIKLNDQVFALWLPKASEAQVSLSNFTRNTILVCIAAAAILAIGVSLFVFSTSSAAGLAVIFNPASLGIMIALLAGATLILGISSLYSSTIIHDSTIEHPENRTPEEPYHSHNIRKDKMHSSENKPEQPLPYHDLKWSLFNRNPYAARESIVSPAIVSEQTSSIHTNRQKL